MKILCWLGFHKWSKWEFKGVNLCHYDEEHWYERKCETCEAVQQEGDV